MQKFINWGIIGAGKIAEKFAQDLSFVKEAKLIGVGSTNQFRAMDFADKFKVPHHYASYNELLANKEIDVLYIANHHPQHFSSAMAAIEAGKHVLCEKPLGMNQTEVSEMIAAAKKKKVFFMEALWTKFLPSYKRAIKLAGTGAIGKILAIHADFGVRMPFDPGSRLFDKQLGGGALLDIGIYPVFLALSVFGAPDRIQANALIGQTGVDIQDAIIMSWNDGRQASLTCSFVVDSSMEAHIIGENGRIRINKQWHAPANLTVFSGRDSFYEITVPSIGHGYSYEASEVVACISSGKIESDIMSHADSLLLIETLDKIRQQIDLVY